MNEFQQPGGSDLMIEYHVITNSYQGKEEFLAELVLVNKSKTELVKGWSVYFNFLRKIQSDSVSEGFNICHVNGDLFCLEPTVDFISIKPGDSVVIQFTASFWAIKSIDRPTGFYIVYKDQNGNEQVPQVLKNIIVRPFTKPEQLRRTPHDFLQVPTPKSRFDDGANMGVLDKFSICPISPTPVFYKKNIETYTFSESIKIGFPSALINEARHLKIMLNKSLDKQILLFENGTGDVQLSLDGNTKIDIDDNESYSIEISEEGVRIHGAESAGVFYGIQSIIMMVINFNESSNQVINLPHCSIADQPLLRYRGLHLDVARNFHSIDTIKRTLSIMSLFKLNKFHIHLTDDEGWRIEINGLPELTDIGSKRGHTINEDQCLFPSYGSGPDINDQNSSGNGFYTREDFIEILRFAALNHIDVIPEIDLPGHARAAIRCMEVRYDRIMKAKKPDQANEFLLTEWDDESQYESVQLWRRNVVNVALPSTYRFIEHVVDEIKSMYEEADIKLTILHLGGDEVPQGVWEKSPECKNLIASTPELNDISDLSDYFLHKVSKILTIRGIKTGGWEEIALSHQNGSKEPNLKFINHHFIPYCWNTGWGDGGENTPYKLANAGFDTILSNAPSLYFDFAYDKDPDEEGFYWGGFNDTIDTFRFLPFKFYKSAVMTAMGKEINSNTAYAKAIKLDETGRENILGIQGQLWGETLSSQERLEYMMLPRLIALAERAWAQEPEWASIEDENLRNLKFAREWNQFANKIGQTVLNSLERLFDNIEFRIPPPGIKRINGRISANCTFPGLIIRYTTDGKTPTEKSTVYFEPLSDQFEVVKMKTFTKSGKCSKESQWLTEHV